jgi:transcriptional regulator with XRE-family HTH domain
MAPSITFSGRRLVMLLRLKLLRLSRGLRQEQVATFLGVPRPHVSEIENGVRNPSARELAGLARLFDCAAEKLLDPVIDTLLDQAETSATDRGVRR